MRKILFSILAIGFYSLGFAQEFQGYAVYESKTSMPKMGDMPLGGREMTPEMRARLQERVKKMFESTFELHFNKTASIYLEQEKIDPTGGNSGMGGRRFMNSMSGGGGTLYKDLKEKNYTVDREFFGKEFLVQDTLTNFKWNITGETKMIGGYNCYKATATIPIKKTDFRNMRMKRSEDEAKKSADEKKTDQKKSEDNGKTTDLLSQIEMPKDIQLTAYFTPEIPVSNGPGDYWGLPGLILEMNDGRTVILCSKVVINPKDKKVIKPSKSGKTITQGEFDKIVLDKLEEFSETGGRGMMPRRN